MLLIRDLQKNYGRFTALSDINLCFEQGVYGLLAPNGAGKTTLIKLITTLLFPTRGEILWNGEDIRKLDEEYRALVGYLPQQFGYYRGYTPVQYLDYLGALKGMGKKAACARAEELLHLVGLQDVMHQKMRKFSGGMIQRVGIAQAMLNDPRILVLDEPTAGLDPGERVRFRNILSQLSRERIVILSTHIVSDIESIAERVIMLRDHKVLYDAPPEDITGLLHARVFEVTSSDPEFARAYPILSQRQTGGATAYRFLLTDGAPPPDAAPCEPGLEDAYLAVYREAQA